MVTIKEALETAFQYNTPKNMGISFDEKMISVDKIKADGYEIGVNHRPVRTAHVNKIISTFVGNTILIDVVYSSKDDLYHIIQGQHVFTACIEKINPESIMCRVIKNDSTGKCLDATIPEDKSKCFEYSFRITEGQERNCMSDKICMVMELSSRYKNETGHTKGVIDYIFENQYGYQKMSKGTIMNYASYGNSLKEHNLLIYAQMEKWDEKMIKARLEQYKLNKKEYENISIKLPKDIAKRFRDSGLTDSSVWKNVFEHKRKICTKQLYEIDEDYD